MGPIFTDAERLRSELGEPVVAVGDVVTYHLYEAGTTPDVSVVDGLTKREKVDEQVAEAVRGVTDSARELRVENPAGTVTRELVETLLDALANPGPTVVVVDGEEDLVTLPAIVAAPLGASVVYGQPDEGMVHASVTEASKTEMRELLGRMDGDPEALLDILQG